MYQFLLFFPVCNVTLSSPELESRSGRTSGELKSPSWLRGPALCWFRFESLPGQRLEMQFYRLMRVGRRDRDTLR